MKISYILSLVSFSVLIGGALFYLQIIPSSQVEQILPSQVVTETNQLKESQKKYAETSADGKGTYDFGYESIIVEEVPNQLTKLDEYFYKDSQHVYVFFDETRSAIIERPIIDTASFELIPFNYRSYDLHYFRDKNNVFVWNMGFSGAVVGLYKVVGVTPSTFELIDGHVPQLSEDNSAVGYTDPVSGKQVTYPVSL